VTQAAWTDVVLGAAPAIEVELEGLELILEGFLLTDPPTGGDPLGEHSEPGRIAVA
jgi:hypothetical protein